MLALSRRLRRRRIVHAARLDVGAAFQPLQARDLLALLSHHALQLSQLAKQPDHQRFKVSASNVREIVGRGHRHREPYPSASREPQNCTAPGVLPRLRLHDDFGRRRDDALPEVLCSAPDGQSVLAPLPSGVAGHFGPDLRRFVLQQHHHGQVTVERLTTQLRAFGLSISKRQVMRLLIDRHDGFLAESRDVLRAGLQTASWISVDDTGARHAGRNGFCTQIGNDDFTWFGTRTSKSRLNFLDLLRAGHSDYVVNDAALDYMRSRSLAGPVISRLATARASRFADHGAWQAHLQHLGISDLQLTPDPVRIATEAALWGAVAGHGFLREAVIVSDDAGQFNIGPHALCWVHAERLVHKLDTFTDRHCAAQQHMRALIWWFYADLKTYRADPSPRRHREMRARFDRIFARRTGFALLDRLLARLHANKPELLVVLDRPEIPLHTNGSERDIRCQVIKRKVSGGTHSLAGRDCRDAFLGLMHTCAKLGIAFWDYLGNRIGVAAQPDLPALPDIILARGQTV